MTTMETRTARTRYSYIDQMSAAVERGANTRIQTIANCGERFGRKKKGFCVHVQIKPTAVGEGKVKATKEEDVDHVHHGNQEHYLVRNEYGQEVEHTLSTHLPRALSKQVVEPRPPFLCQHCVPAVFGKRISALVAATASNSPSNAELPVALIEGPHCAQGISARTRHSMHAPTPVHKTIAAGMAFL